MSSLDELYEKLGVRKGISAAGTTTMYGGSQLRPEVTQIMIEASTVMLDMDLSLIHISEPTSTERNS